MRANSPFTISGRGLGVFEGQDFATVPHFGRVYSGFMGDFGDPGPMTSMPGVRQSVESEMFGLGEESLFGLGEDALFGDEGLFGGDLFGGDLFGFGQAMIADPTAAKNAPLMAIAKVKIEEYKKNRALIPSLPTKAQQDEAMAIVNKGWYRNEGLDELLKSIEWRANPPGAFYQLQIEGTSVRISDTGKKRLDAFRSGNAKLREYMGQFIVNIMPERRVEEVLKTVGLDSATLLNKALVAAQKARQSRSAMDAVAARSFAESAIEAAKQEEEAQPGIATENLRAAEALFDEMDALAQAAGAPPPPAPTAAEIPWVPIGIAVGVVALGLTVYLAMKG